MPARSKKIRKKLTRSSNTGRILGAKAFEAITAVEGLTLSAAGRKRLKALKTRKMSQDARRAAVVRAYTRTKAPK